MTRVQRTRRLLAVGVLALVACTPQPKEAQPPVAEPVRPRPKEPVAAAQRQCTVLEAPAKVDVRLEPFEAPNGRAGYRDADGRPVIAPRFLDASEFGPGGIASAVESLDGGYRHVFIDASGRVLAQAYAYDNGADYFVQGRARVIIDGKVGFIDPSGRIVIVAKYDWASPFSCDRAAVCIGCVLKDRRYSGGKWGVIGLRGEVVLDTKYDEIRQPLWDSPDKTVEVRLDKKWLRVSFDGAVEQNWQL